MLADLIWEYMEARKELEEAKKDCDGSWGYYLHDLTERVDDLADKIEMS